MVSDSKEQLTALDWIAVLITGLLIIAIASAPFSVSVVFLEMFESFGGTLEELPLVTRLALSPWYGLLSPLPSLSVLVWGLFSHAPLVWRRAAIVASFCLGLMILGFYLFGAYAPIFEIADTVGP
jgi:hypothetical protein